jgi:hypothetical protein
MMDLRVIAVRTDLVDEMRRTLLSPGYGHTVTSKVATGHGPCRHCLEPFEVGKDVRMLFTFDSFEGMDAIPQPGPVFVHQRECERFAEEAGYPPRLREFGAVLDGYDSSQRVARRELVTDGAQEKVLMNMFTDVAIRYILVRDLSAGCYDFRVERREE